MKTFNQLEFLVVHCSATKPDNDIGRREIDRWHKAKGWRGIGYHFLIRRNGDIEIGRQLHEVGAHAKGFNKLPNKNAPQSWGICLAGGVDANGKPEDNFTAEQQLSLAILLTGLKQRAPNASILGHRDLFPDLNGDGVIDKNDWLKDCPCFDVRAWCATHGIK